MNEWEQANILEAETWLNNFNFAADFGRQTAWEEVLQTKFIQQVHRKMFDKTWRWAGKFRKSNKNIGVDWCIIHIQLKTLLDDVVYQVTNQSYEIDEIATRLHHRLVAIHPFPNGNGRHARCITDLFLKTCGQPKFSWGQSTLYENSLIRKRYIKALRTADQHNYSSLLAFVRAG